MKDAKDGGGGALFLIQHDIAHKMQSGRGRSTVQCDFNGSNGMAVAKGFTSHAADMLTNDAAEHYHLQWKSKRASREESGKAGNKEKPRAAGKEAPSIDSDDDDKRFTFSKSNGGISHRKAKDTQPRA
ncbi:GD15938 [Drosophila simulans]|uniref:GD15938 n=1 Tax=Drosophila simulans TaxID=7240 RepID=B4R3M5_DROSI|nr:GD15938 [Drosophila simulans]